MYTTNKYHIPYRAGDAIDRAIAKLPPQYRELAQQALVDRFRNRKTDAVWKTPDGKEIQTSFSWRNISGKCYCLFQVIVVEAVARESYLVGTPEAEDWPDVPPANERGAILV